VVGRSTVGCVLGERITGQTSGGLGGRPFDRPPVAQIVKNGFEFTAPVTFLVGAELTM
jgi:hypothetical protein